MIRYSTWSITEAILFKRMLSRRFINLGYTCCRHLSYYDTRSKGPDMSKDTLFDENFEVRKQLYTKKINPVVEFTVSRWWKLKMRVSSFWKLSLCYLLLLLHLIGCCHDFLICHKLLWLWYNFRAWRLATVVFSLTFSLWVSTGLVEMMSVTIDQFLFLFNAVHWACNRKLVWSLI